MQQQQQHHPMLAQAIALARSGRLAEGIALLRRLAEAGEPEALFLLAETTWVGGPVPQDFARGRELFRRGSEAGHPRAHMAYTNLLASGIAGERDWPAAIARLRLEARSDPGRARVLARIDAMSLDDQGDPAILPAPDRLSDAPAVQLFPAAFTAEECAYLLETADPVWKPCLVTDGKGGYVQDPIRTAEGSTTHWLVEDPAVHALNRRLAALSDTTPEQGEALQLLRYRPGQQYRAHVDYDGGDNGRIKTALVYLNEDYEGGETLFVKTGLKVKGRTGDVLVFVSARPDGSLDPLSEHAGLPVESGVKYLGSRWIHERRYSA
ncbi:MAG TPA: 2OG-Fe(II) oxygenase [Allosphingosinicella sp.]|nr:2OG-Fe(II) oxygenase [Allosphingosinicella sp.]